MRHACLEAQAARASPVLFKVLVHAANGMLADFSELFRSWTSVALCAAFLFTGAPMALLLPMARAYAQRVASRGHASARSEYQVLCVQPSDEGEYASWSTIDIDDVVAHSPRAPIRWLKDRLRRRPMASRKLIALDEDDERNECL